MLLNTVVKPAPAAPQGWCCFDEAQSCSRKIWESDAKGWQPAQGMGWVMADEVAVAAGCTSHVSCDVVRCSCKWRVMKIPWFLCSVGVFTVYKPLDRAGLGSCPVGGFTATCGLDIDMHSMVKRHNSTQHVHIQNVLFTYLQHACNCCSCWVLLESWLGRVVV